MIKYFLIIISLVILAACIHNQKKPEQSKPVIEDLVAFQMMPNYS